LTWVSKTIFLNAIFHNPDNVYPYREGQTKLFQWHHYQLTPFSINVVATPEGNVHNIGTGKFWFFGKIRRHPRRACATRCCPCTRPWSRPFTMRQNASNERWRTACSRSVRAPEYVWRKVCVQPEHALKYIRRGWGFSIV